MRNSRQRRRGFFRSRAVPQVAGGHRQLLAPASKLQSDRQARGAGQEDAMQSARERCEANFMAQVCSAVVRIQDDAATNMAEAMAQLEAGTYGYCVDCLVEIPAERLAAVTFAIRCADCERNHVRTMTRDGAELGPVSVAEFLN
jgi:RNA polymerase-binding transcription factor DksA